MCKDEFAPTKSSPKLETSAETRSMPYLKQIRVTSSYTADDGSLIFNTLQTPQKPQRIDESHGELPAAS